MTSDSLDKPAASTGCDVDVLDKQVVEKDGDVGTGGPELFPSLGSDELVDNLTCVESLCMSCYEQGVTKLLLTRIPHYKDVVVSSFYCEHCGYSNTQIQSCGPVQNRGVTYTVNVEGEQDMNRQVVKGEHATIRIPELDLEIPKESQTGSISTIEGILQRVIDGLAQDQKQRALVDPEGFNQVQDFIEKVAGLKFNSCGFQFVLDDPSGNSFVENPWAPKLDEHGSVSHYIRTLEHDDQLGLAAPEEHDAVATTNGNHEDVTSGGDAELDFKNEVMTFSSNCPICGAVCETNMKAIKIPFFKEVIIMATNCEKCGHRSDEVKSATGVEPQGVKFTCVIKDEFDLNRDVLKSETCSLQIPELEVELEHGSLGGQFTTIEGLVKSFLEGVDRLNPFLTGDSSDGATLSRIGQFTTRAKALLSLSEPFTIVLDDPAGNSFISKTAEDDTQLTEERYERSFEQNEFLGLNDMKTENYDHETTNGVENGHTLNGITEESENEQNGHVTQSNGHL